MNKRKQTLSVQIIIFSMCLSIILQGDLSEPRAMKLLDKDISHLHSTLSTKVLSQDKLKASYSTAKFTSSDVRTLAADELELLLFADSPPIPSGSHRVYRRLVLKHEDKEGESVILTRAEIREGIREKKILAVVAGGIEQFVSLDRIVPSKESQIVRGQRFLLKGTHETRYIERQLQTILPWENDFGLTIGLVYPHDETDKRVFIFVNGQYAVTAHANGEMISFVSEGMAVQWARGTSNQGTIVDVISSQLEGGFSLTIQMLDNGSIRVQNYGVRPATLLREIPVKDVYNEIAALLKKTPGKGLAFDIVEALIVGEDASVKSMEGASELINAIKNQIVSHGQRNLESIEQLIKSEMVTVKLLSSPKTRLSAKQTRVGRSILLSHLEKELAAGTVAAVVITSGGESIPQLIDLMPTMELARQRLRSEPFQSKIQPEERASMGFDKLVYRAA